MEAHTNTPELPPAPPAPVQATPAPQPSAQPEAAAGFDPIRFQQEHRIHVLGGSYIGQGDDMFLTVHPQEMKPENQPALRARMQRIFTHQEPMWFTAPGRLAMVASLSELIPLSTEAEGAKLSEMIQHFIKKTSTGKDPDVAEHDEKSAAPFAAFVKRLQEDKPLKPDQIEAVKNGIGLYLLLEKAVEGKHAGGLAALAGNLAMQPHNAEKLFAVMQPYTGFDITAIRQAAQSGGLAAAGKALGVDDAYTQDVIRLVNHLPEHKFAANAVENWKIGRQQPGMANAGTHEKIMAGVGPRIEQKLKTLQGLFKNRTEVSPEIAAMEQEIAGRMRQLLPPAVAEAYFRKGGDIIYSPKSSLSNGPGILFGLNRHTKAHRDDVLGIDHIFVSGGFGPEKSQDTLVHEFTHTLYPNYLTETDIARVDALTLSDRQRLQALREIVNKWEISTSPEEKAALEQQVESGFAVGGKPWSQMRGAATMQSLYTLVNEAWNNLTSESSKLTLSGYSEPESRMAEINSRYAGMRFVGHNNEPDLLRFVVPGLTEAYDQIYLPHIERALADLRIRQMPQATVEKAKQSSIVVPNPAPHAHSQQIRTLSTPPAPEQPTPQIDARSVALHPPVNAVQAATNVQLQ